MKKIILMLSMGLFLYAFSMHVKVSVDSPMQLVTEEALAQSTGGCLCCNVTINGICYWIHGSACRKHSSTNTCEPGNCISFRPCCGNQTMGGC